VGHLVTLVLAVFIVALPRAGEAQPTAGVVRIGYLSTLSAEADSPNRAAFRQGLRAVGYALKNRLPTISGPREFVDAGGLLAYGPHYPDLFRRTATYVDKIFKGTRPADLPVEQPTKFELAINRRTAKGLGLTIPPSLLLHADHVVE
jgi:putative ABC transport system substrate-binding protein